MLRSRRGRGGTEKRSVIQNVPRPSRSADSPSRAPKQVGFSTSLSLPKRLPDGDDLQMESSPTKDVLKKRVCKVTNVKTKSADGTKDIKNKKMYAPSRPQSTSSRIRDITEGLSSKEMDDMSEELKTIGNCLVSLEGNLSGGHRHQLVSNCNPKAVVKSKRIPTVTEGVGQQSEQKLGRLYNVTDYTPVVGSTSETYLCDLAHQLAESYDSAVMRLCRTKSQNSRVAVEEIRKQLEEWRNTDQEHRTQSSFRCKERGGTPAPVAASRTEEIPVQELAPTIEDSRLLTRGSNGVFELNEADTRSENATDYPLDNYLQPTVRDQTEDHFGKIKDEIKKNSEALKKANKLLKLAESECSVSVLNNQVPPKAPSENESEEEHYAEKLVDVKFYKSTSNVYTCEPKAGSQKPSNPAILQPATEELITSNVNKKSTRFKQEGRLHEIKQSTSIQRKIVRNGHTQKLRESEMSKKPNTPTQYELTMHRYFDNLNEGVDPMQYVTSPRNGSKSYTHSLKETCSPCYSSKQSSHLKTCEVHDKACHSCSKCCLQKEKKEQMGDAINQEPNINNRCMNYPTGEILGDSSGLKINDLPCPKSKSAECHCIWTNREFHIPRSKSDKFNVATNTEPRVNTAFVTVTSQQLGTDEVCHSGRDIKIQELPKLNIRPELTKQVTASIDIPTAVEEFNSQRNNNIRVVNLVHTVDQNGESDRYPMNDQPLVEGSSSTSHCSRCKFCFNKEQCTELSRSLQDATVSFAERNSSDNATDNCCLKESLEHLVRSVESIYSMQLEELRNICDGNSSKRENDFTSKMRVVADLLAEDEFTDGHNRNDRYTNAGRIIRQLVHDIELNTQVKKSDKNKPRPHILQNEKAPQKRVVSCEGQITTEGMAKNQISKNRKQRTNSLTNFQEMSLRRGSQRSSENNDDSDNDIEKSRKLISESYVKYSVNKPELKNIPFRKLSPKQGAKNVVKGECSGIILKRPQQVCDINKYSKLVAQNNNESEMLKLDETFVLSSSSSSIKINAKHSSEITANQRKDVGNEYEDDWEPDVEVMSEDNQPLTSEESSTKTYAVQPGKIELNSELASEEVNLEPPHSKNDDNMSDGEVGYLYTSNSYSSGEIKPRDRKEADGNTSFSSNDELFVDMSQKERKVTPATLFLDDKQESVQSQIKSLKQGHEINTFTANDSEINRNQTISGVIPSVSKNANTKGNDSENSLIQSSVNNESGMHPEGRSDSSDVTIPELIELLQKCSNSLTDSSKDHSSTQC